MKFIDAFRYFAIKIKETEKRDLVCDEDIDQFDDVVRIEALLFFANMISIKRYNKPLFDDVDTFARQYHFYVDMDETAYIDKYDED